mmetsp:Transcript_27016/g.77944  ORF Transcript_27016/g.77944 Transcript_27016/m.77944 type:complete len:229 (+) Transcript_27016:159-845(+)
MHSVPNSSVVLTDKDRVNDGLVQIPNATAKSPVEYCQRQGYVREGVSSLVGRALSKCSTTPREGGKEEEAPQEEAAEQDEATTEHSGQEVGASTTKDLGTKSLENHHEDCRPKEREIETKHLHAGITVLVGNFLAVTILIAIDSGMVIAPHNHHKADKETEDGKYLDGFPGISSPWHIIVELLVASGLLFDERLAGGTRPENRVGIEDDGTKYQVRDSNDEANRRCDV